MQGRRGRALSRSSRVVLARRLAPVGGRAVTYARRATARGVAVARYVK